MPHTSLQSLDKIVSFAKQRGFIFPSSEIYGGLSSCYDYGPLGMLLKDNVKKAWWRALVQTRKIDRTDFGIKQAIKFNRIDTTIALNLAFFVNAAILILAAKVFFASGNSDVAEIKEAHRLLPSFLGNVAPVLFAVALISEYGNASKNASFTLKHCLVTSSSQVL